MSLAYNCYLLAKTQHARIVDAEGFARAYGLTMESLTPVYDALWSEIHTIRHGDAVLKSIIDGTPPLPIAIE